VKYLNVKFKVGEDRHEDSVVKYLESDNFLNLIYKS